MKKLTEAKLNQMTKRSGRKCLANGVRYENRILQILSGFDWNQHPIIITSHITGGSSRLNDVVVMVNGRRIAFEVKNKNSFEGGSKVLKKDGTDGSLMLPSGLFGNEDGHVPWGGRTPSFIDGDKSIETWEKEKPFFRAEYRPISMDAVRLYYKQKGSDYIQVEGKGLYHTGDDPLTLGVPLFKCLTKIRIRCKQHTSSTLPSSVQASLVFDRKRLTKSTHDLESRLPPCLRHRWKDENLG